MILAGTLSKPPKASPASLFERTSSQQCTFLTSQKKSRFVRRDGPAETLEAVATRDMRAMIDFVKSIVECILVFGGYLDL